MAGARAMLTPIFSFLIEVLGHCQELLQPLLLPAPLNSGSFAPFRLKVVSDAAWNRRYEIGPR